MKIGYIGKREIKKFLAGKPYTVYPKKTKAKIHQIHLDEQLALSADDVLNIANAVGISEKLGLSDGKMLFAFAKSLILSERGNLRDLKDYYEAN